MKLTISPRDAVTWAGRALPATPVLPGHDRQASACAVVAGLISRANLAAPAAESPDRTVTVISFGYGHGAPPEADATFDVRRHFKDPHVSPALRDLTAADPPVVEAVLSTPGIPALIEAITSVARAFRAAPSPGPLTIAVGCVGGRHRSAVIAAEVARRMDLEGIPAVLSHRDISRPVIARRPASPSPS